MNSVCYCLKNQIAMNEKWIFDMTVVLKNEAQNKILWLLILWNVMILKYHEIHTGQKPFSCRMCKEKVWNVMGRYTQEKCLLLAGCGMIHFEMLGGYTHRRKALYPEIFFAWFFGKCKQVFVRDFELDDFLDELDKILQWVRQVFQRLKAFQNISYTISYTF